MVPDGRFVCRTMINRGRSIIGKQNSIFYVTRGQVILDVSEDPGTWEADQSTGYWGNTGVLRWQSVAMIVGIHQPTELELVEVPQALDSLRVGLRPREGGQKQAGQDRDDRDDDQQLNERECISCAAFILTRVATDMDRTSAAFCFHFLFAFASGRILIPPPRYAARRKGTQRLRCSMGRCSHRGSLKAAFRRRYQDAPALVQVAE